MALVPENVRSGGRRAYPAMRAVLEFEVWRGKGYLFINGINTSVTKERRMLINSGDFPVRFA